MKKLKIITVLFLILGVGLNAQVQHLEFEGAKMRKEGVVKYNPDIKTSFKIYINIRYVEVEVDGETWGCAIKGVDEDENIIALKLENKNTLERTVLIIDSDGGVGLMTRNMMVIFAESKFQNFKDN